ncbi:hypothetical protein PHLGIDRAFT_299626 [Phlebiopsis gigantea 11061_1 CR5-6]|uniref:Uncharacterized protein n=1 Tax=Phlebiopsis gigantea (strain 11061_1 CR5-6) TaxID=745531 RepID=A0A0C3S3B0_PHLG1|nr:hypothetical protein PHLGIDRAFT_299626 [Phlebiopsis gigantea 11061_1 CR5-6]
MISVAISRLGVVIKIVCESLVYGLFIALIPLSTALVVKQAHGREWKRRTCVIMLAVIWTTFCLSTSLWISTFAAVVAKIRSPFGSAGTTISNIYEMTNALGRLNFAFADAVLLWRVWVLCHHAQRGLLMVATGTLAISTVSVIATAGVRLAIIVLPAPDDGNNNHLTTLINVFQVATLVLSFSTNVMSTSIVGYHALKNWQDIYRSYLRRQTNKSQRVVVLIVESGIFYTIYVVISLVCTFIRVPTGTLGDITNKVLVHIAGVYSTFIITMVSIQGSISISALSNRQPQISTSNEASRGVQTLVFARQSTLERSAQSPGYDRSPTMSHGRPGTPDSMSTRSNRSSWKVLTELVKVPPIKTGDIEPNEVKPEMCIV